MGTRGSTAVVYRLQADKERLKRDLDRAKGHLRGYQSSASKFGRELRGTMAAAFSIGAISAFGNAQFNLVKKLDTTNRTLKAVTSSAEEYGEAKKFLIDTADELGVNVLNLTENYSKWTVAIKGSKIEGEKGNEVFRKIAKSAAVLGLSADELSGILRALSQMMSKGKVTAEELKLQLGDRLPGSMEAMARAADVSKKELFKMLEAGTLIAEDMLPKFADEIQTTFGADKIQMVDNMQSASERLKNEWKLLIESIEDGNGRFAQAFKLITAIGALSLKSVRGEGTKSSDLLINSIPIIGSIIGADSSNKKTSEGFTGPLQKDISQLDLIIDKLKELNKIAQESKIDLFIPKEPLRDIGRNVIAGLKGVDFQVPTDDDLAESMFEALTPPTEEIAAEWDYSSDVIHQKFLEMQDKMKAEADTLNAIIASTFTEGIVSITESVFSGNLKDLFENFKSVLANGLTAMGRALIAMGIGEEAFLKSFGAAKIPAGIALVGLGAAFRAASASANSSAAGSLGGGSRGGGYRNISGQSIQLEPIKLVLSNDQLEGWIRQRDYRRTG